MKKLMPLFITLILGSPAVLGENILIPLGRQGSDVAENLPHRGMLKSEVREMLGEPLKTVAPVGEPPISSWEYNDFKVFFEYDHVIHVVKKYRPQHPEAID